MCEYMSKKCKITIHTKEKEKNKEIKGAGGAGNYFSRLYYHFCEYEFLIFICMSKQNIL